MTDPVLYRSIDGLIFLLDLPRSIEDAQSLPGKLSSSPAPQEAYPSTEPKGAKREKLLILKSGHVVEQENELSERIRDALTEITLHAQTHGLNWCLPRYTLDEAKEYTSTPEAKGQNVVETSRYEDYLVPLILSTSEETVNFPSLTAVSNRVVHNPGDTFSYINTGDHDYLIPARSNFILSTIKDGQKAFDTATSILFDPTKHATIQFDLILMDPPWSNRSVRHAKTYTTVENQVDDPFLQTLPMIQDYTSPQGIVAIWITNKPSIRDAVLTSLNHINFFLSEEWIWVKVTESGQLVTQLDGIWRKPYEVLLLFRPGLKDIPLVRKILVTVPDKHSRKPSIKRLIEPQLPSPYLALELFARNLTAGWWSWGNEVLKFQARNQWSMESLEE